MVAIDFDHELVRDTGEVGEGRPDRILAPKLHPAHAAIREQFPADSFSTTAVAAKLAGTGSCGVLLLPLTRPLPLAGERSPSSRRDILMFLSPFGREVR
jgi:hypothetical protein